MPEKALYWLGTPRIESGGRLIRLETRKITAILAFLSVEQRPVSREYLAAMFWPEYDAVRAPANLRRALASLRKTLGPGWVRISREGAEYCAGPETTVDCGRLFNISTTVKKAPAQADETEAETVREAAALYRGDFLEGFNLKDSPGFDEWQTGIRVEFLDRVTRALQWIIEYNRNKGNMEAAIEAAQRLIFLDQLNEAAHRSLMALLAGKGNRSGALRQYELCRGILSTELDAEPEEETADLAEQIRSGKITPAPAQVTARSSGTGNAATPFPTKLSPPRPRPARVDRSRLFPVLDEGMQRHVTLISAPAGFGKTTLVVDWLINRGLSPGWISIEENDNDPVRFLSALAAACGTVNSELGTASLGMLQSMQRPPLEIIGTALARDITQAGAAFLLVIDDLHLLRNSRTQEILSRFIEQISGLVHIFITTRSDPALPLARLRARDQLVEIRADDLRFTIAETASFFSRVMNVHLNDDDIKTLEQRTEGWAAGLQMAGISLKRYTDRSGFIKTFGGSHRYIMDYLMEEVLQGLPGNTRDFLLKTSIVHQICGDLGDELTERENSQRILEELERENIFLTALDDSRTWYRYHHLFSQLLRHRLSRTRGPGEIRILHRKAGCWFETRGDYEKAMRHYLEGGNYNEVFRLLDDRIEPILTSGGLGLLLEWKNHIPEDAAFKNLKGCVNLGIITAFAGRPEETERYFSRAEKLFGTADSGSTPDKERRLRGQLCVMRAFLADVAGYTGQALELARTGERLIPGKRVMARSLIPYILGRIYRHKGELEHSESYLQQQIELALQAQNPWSLSGGVHELIWICRLRGTLNRAEQILKRYTPYFKDRTTSGPVAKITAARAEILRERGDLEEAEQTAEQALRSVEGWGLPSDVCFCLQIRLRIALSRGRTEEARITMEKIDEITASEPVHASILPLYEAERIRIYLTLGMIPEALSRLSSYQYNDKDAVINREVIDIAKARVYIAEGNIPEAESLLTRLALNAEAGGRAGRLIEILILQSVTAEGKNRYYPLNRALELGEPEKFTRLFLDEGDWMTELLKTVPDEPDFFSPAAVRWANRLLSL